jgi:hypothetical protein
MTEMALLILLYGPALAMALAALGLAVGVVLIIAKWRKTGAAVCVLAVMLAGVVV